MGELDLETLRLLRTIAETGSMSQAARLSGRSQQAVSARLRQAERRLGFPLLERDATGSRLSQQGVLVHSWAAPLLAAEEGLSAGIDSLRAERRLSLGLAASQTIAAHLVPRWLVQLRAAEAEAGVAPTRPTLGVGNSAWVCEEVRAGRAELGFIESPRLPSDLLVRRLGGDELAAVASPDHALAAAGALTLAELAAQPLVLREPGSGTRAAFEDACAVGGVRGQLVPTQELSTTAAVIASVAAGVGVGVLSRLAVADELALGRLIELPLAGAPLTRPLSAVLRPGTDPGDAGRALLDIAAA